MKSLFKKVVSLVILLTMILSAMTLMKTGEVSANQSESLQEKLMAVYREFTEKGWDELNLDYSYDSLDKIGKGLQKKGWLFADQNYYTEEVHYDEAMQYLSAKALSYEMSVYGKPGSRYIDFYFNAPDNMPASVSENRSVLRSLAPDQIIDVLGIKDLDDLLSPFRMEDLLLISTKHVPLFECTWNSDKGKNSWFVEWIQEDGHEYLSISSGKSPALYFNGNGKMITNVGLQVYN